jgi:signal transduction histidine kinase
VQLLDTAADSLLDLMREGAGESDPERLIGLICEHAARLAGADYAGLRLVDEVGHAEWRGMWGNRSDAWKRPRPSSYMGSASEALTTGQTVVSRVPDMAAAGKPIHAHSVRASEGAVVELATPLTFSGRSMGALVLGWRSDVQLEPERVRIAELLAGYAALVLDGANSRLQSERRRAQAEALAELVRQGAAEHDTERAIALVCDQARRLLDADYASMVLVEEDDTLVWHGTSGNQTTWQAPTRNRGAGPTRVALENGRPVVFERLQERTDFARFHRREGGRTAVAAPCFGHTGVSGVLHIGWRHDVTVSPAQVQLADALAGYAAVILDNARGHAALEDRAETIRQANVQLTYLDEMKSNLLSNVSHELRTPLSSIRAFSELLMDPNLAPDTRHEFTSIINSEAERLSRLVTNLLDLSRIQAHGVVWHIQPLDVGKQLELAAASLRPSAAERQLELCIDLAESLPQAMADPDGLQQVLLNLLSNAVKFTDAGEVRLSAAAVDGCVRVAVADTGPGITEDQQAAIFDRFYQAGDILTSKPSGSGLGLAITKEILLQHGSDISLSSEPGAGSTFSFLLPIAT